MDIIFSARGNKSVSNFLNVVRKKEANLAASDFSDLWDESTAHSIIS